MELNLFCPGKANWNQLSNSIFQQEGLLRRVVPPIQLHPKSHVSDFVEETGGTLQKSLYKIHKGGVATHYKIRAPDPPCLHPFSLFGPRNPVYKIRTFRIVNQKLYKMHLGGGHPLQNESRPVGVTFSTSFVQENPVYKKGELSMVSPDWDFVDWRVVILPTVSHDWDFVDWRVVIFLTGSHDWDFVDWRVVILPTVSHDWD